MIKVKIKCSSSSERKPMCFKISWVAASVRGECVRVRARSSKPKTCRSVSGRACRNAPKTSESMSVDHHSSGVSAYVYDVHPTRDYMLYEAYW